MKIVAVCGVCGGRLRAEFNLMCLRNDDTVEIDCRPHRCPESRLKALVRMADGSVNEDDYADLRKDALL